MDTSQAHLSSKGAPNGKDTSKPENLSKDELTAVLKYGAQKMSVCLLMFQMRYVRLTHCHDAGSARMTARRIRSWTN